MLEAFVILWCVMLVVGLAFMSGAWVLNQEEEE